MANDSTKRNMRIIHVGAGFLIGFLVGAGFMAASKANRLADDIHAVKQDYDKAKVKVVEDYKAVSEKGKEAIKNLDANDLGKSATEGLKDLGHSAKEGTKELGAAWKDKMLKKLKEDREK